MKSTEMMMDFYTSKQTISILWADLLTNIYLKIINFLYYIKRMGENGFFDIFVKILGFEFIDIFVNNFKNH